MFYDRFVELCKGKKVSASRAAIENGNAYKKDQKSGGLSAPALWTVGDNDLSPINGTLAPDVSGDARLGSEYNGGCPICGT